MPTAAEQSRQNDRSIIGGDGEGEVKAPGGHLGKHEHAIIVRHEVVDALEASRWMAWPPHGDA